VPSEERRRQGSGGQKSEKIENISHLQKKKNSQGNTNQPEKRNRFWKRKKKKQKLKRRPKPEDSKLDISWKKTERQNNPLRDGKKGKALLRKDAATGLGI